LQLLCAAAIHTHTHTHTMILYFLLAPRPPPGVRPCCVHQTPGCGALSATAMRARAWPCRHWRCAATGGPWHMETGKASAWPSW
jgi:hypothetical protein